MPSRFAHPAGLLVLLSLLGACGGMDPSGDAAANATKALVDAVTSGTTGGGDGVLTGAGTSGTTGASTGGTDSAGSTGGTTTAATGGSTTGGTVTGGGNACTPDGWDNYVKAKFATSCGNNCHGISFSTLPQVKNDVTAVRDRIDRKNMPKGSTLDANTYTRLLKWIDCGLPQ